MLLEGTNERITISRNAGTLFIHYKLPNMWNLYYKFSKLTRVSLVHRSRYLV
jgi:hypothetical protein